MDETKKRLSDSKADAGIAIRQPDIVADELNLLIDGALGYAIYMLDPNGKVTIWNEGARRLKGWPEAEVIGKEAALFYPAEAVAPGSRGKTSPKRAASGAPPPPPPPPPPP